MSEADGIYDVNPNALADVKAQEAAAQATRRGGVIRQAPYDSSKRVLIEVSPAKKKAAADATIQAEFNASEVKPTPPAIPKRKPPPLPPKVPTVAEIKDLEAKAKSQRKPPPLPPAPPDIQLPTILKTTKVA